MSERDVIRFYPEQDCYYFDFTPYSQLSVKINAHNYYTLNHYYQAERTGRVDLIFKIYTAAGATDLARYLLRQNKVTFSANRKQQIMMQGLEAKFDQHPYLREKLIATGSKQLVFYHMKDPFWGTGENPKSASNHDGIEFFDKDKAYFEFTPYSSHSLFLDGILWNTLNHYFQAQKFTSNNEKRKIADALTADRATYNANYELKRFSKSQTFNEKEKIMERGLEAKFTQHTDLRRMLLATGTRTLLFIHPEDVFWGTGTPKSGKNKLGELLMNLRNQLHTRQMITTRLT